MKAQHLITLLGLLMCSVLFVQAQSTSTVLTLEEAVRLGLAQSNQLKVSQAKHEVMQAKVSQYWNAAVIPNVSLNSGYSRLSNNITPYTVSFPNGNGGYTEQALNPQILNQFTNRLSVQQILYAGGRGINFFRSAELLEKASALDVEKDRIEIKNTIIAAVLNLYKLQTAARILEENRTVLQSRLRNVQNFVQNGTALENDQFKAELAINQVESNLEELKNGIATAKFNLSLMLGLDKNATIELDQKSLFASKNLLSLDAYLQTVAKRPDLNAATYRQQASEKSLAIAKGNYLPLISIGANYYENRPNQRIFPQQDAFKGTWDAGLTLSFNLSNLYTNKFQVQEAKVNLAQSGAQKELLSDAAQMEIASSYYAQQSAMNKIELAEKAIKQSLENQRITKNQFDAQVTPLTQLLEADFQVIQSQLNLETAKIEAELAYWKLQKAIGQ